MASSQSDPRAPSHRRRGTGRSPVSAFVPWAGNLQAKRVTGIMTVCSNQLMKAASIERPLVALSQRTLEPFMLRRCVSQDGSRQSLAASWSVNWPAPESVSTASTKSGARQVSLRRRPTRTHPRLRPTRVRRLKRGHRFQVSRASGMLARSPSKAHRRFSARQGRDPGWPVGTTIALRPPRCRTASGTRTVMTSGLAA